MVKTMPEERILVARARQGDAEAFEHLVRTHYERTLRFATFQVHDRGAAADCVQEALLKAWRSLPEFEGTSTFSTWLHAIVRNTCHDYRRRPTAAPVDVSGYSGLSDPAETRPEQQSQNRAFVSAVNRVLDDLPSDLHHAWVLRELHCCTYEQVATALGVSVATARGRIHRARSRVATAMEAWQ